MTIVSKLLVFGIDSSSLFQLGRSPIAFYFDGRTLVDSTTKRKSAFRDNEGD